MNFKTIIYILLLTFVVFLKQPLSAVAAPPPIVLYTDIASGPKSGGEGNNGAYLSIFGKNFGTDINAITVTIGGGAVARKMFLGASYGRPDIQQLSVQLGPNVATGSIKVSIGGIDSNTDKIFTVRAGNIYFVSLTGNDATGVPNDVSHPYRTLNYLARTLGAFRAGDFAVVRGGTYTISDTANGAYNGGWMRPNKSGSGGSPITVYGYPGETVTIALSPGYVLFNNYDTLSYWTVANFAISLTVCDINQGSNVIQAGSPAASCPMSGTGKVSYINFVNLGISGGCMSSCSGCSPIEIAWSDHSKLLGVSVHDSGDAGATTSHPFYLSAEQSNTEVGWCALYNIARSRGVLQVHQDGFGGTCYGRKTLTDIYIHDNLFHDLNAQALLLGGGVGDVYIYNNLFYNIGLNSGNTYDDVLTFRVCGGVANIRFYNNTLYVNPYQTGAGTIMTWGDVAGCTSPNSNVLQASVYNNIFNVTESQDIYSRFETNYDPRSVITSDCNIWYGSSSGLPSFRGPNDKSAAPNFAYPSQADFSLLSNNACRAANVILPIRKDIAGNLRAATPSIGSFEFISGSVPPRAPVLH